MQMTSLSIRAVTYYPYTQKDSAQKKYMSEFGKRESCRTESVVGLPEKKYIYLSTVYVKQFTHHFSEIQN